MDRADRPYRQPALAPNSPGVSGIAALKSGAAGCGRLYLLPTFYIPLLIAPLDVDVARTSGCVDQTADNIPCGLRHQRGP